MNKPKRSRPPDKNIQSLPILNSDTTVPPSNSKTYFYRKEISMKPEYQDLIQQIQSLQKDLNAVTQQIQALQKETKSNKNQWGYCSVALNKLGFSTDEHTLKEYQDWSEGNYWDD